MKLSDELKHEARSALAKMLRLAADRLMPVGLAEGIADVKIGRVTEITPAVLGPDPHVPAYPPTVWPTYPSPYIGDVPGSSIPWPWSGTWC